MIYYLFRIDELLKRHSRKRQREARQQELKEFERNHQMSTIDGGAVRALPPLGLTKGPRLPDVGLNLDEEYKHYPPSTLHSESEANYAVNNYYPSGPSQQEYYPGAASQHEYYPNAPPSQQEYYGYTADVNYTAGIPYPQQAYLNYYETHRSEAYSDADYKDSDRLAYHDRVNNGLPRQRQNRDQGDFLE